MDPHIREQIRSGRADAGIESIGQRCTIATSATSASDEVHVTIDDDPEPKERRLVEWRPRITDAGPIARLFPERGDKGVIIETDIGRPWLLW